MCKCAFHNDFCKEVGLEKDEAGFKVVDEYNKYVEQQVLVFAKQCMSAGGIYSVVPRQCEYCEDKKVRDDGICVDKAKSLEEQFGLPKVDTTGGSGVVGNVIDSEGEFFVYSPGRGKWIGPVRGYMTLFEGDVLYTTPNGRASVQLGNTRMLLAERTTIKLRTPQIQRHVLVQGIINIWETLKKLGANEAFEVEGAHSITGRKGTDFIMKTSPDGDIYTVNEGSIEIKLKSAPTTKKTVEAGKSAIAAKTIVDNTYAWDELLTKYGWTQRDFSEAPKVEPFGPYDPDALNPPEAAYTGKLYLPYEQPSSKKWIWGIVVIFVVAGGWFFVKKKKK